MTAPTPSSGSRWNLDRVASVLLIVTCSVVTVFAVLDRFDRRGSVPRPKGNPLPVPAKPVSLQGAALRGDPNARVVLIEFSDFECPFCARFARDVQPELDRLYVRSGKVKVAFRHVPLPSHRFAQKAAEAAECSGRQGRFWEMHDAIFDRQQDLGLGTLVNRATGLGLDRTQFETCLDGQATEKVKADLALAKSLFVLGTPTFFVGTELDRGLVRVVQRLDGAASLGDFKKVLETVLATARPN